MSDERQDDTPPPADSAERLSGLARELEAAAARLADPQVGADEAAQIATRSADLASQAAVELERQARSEPFEPVPGQEELL